MVDPGFAMVLIISSLLLVTAAAEAATNATKSSRDGELKALMDFGWPYMNRTTDHCKWHGIACDDGGRVAEIILLRGEPVISLDELDLLAFPYLERIQLSPCSGSIPAQIGRLSKLTHLVLSGYGLKGELPISLTDLTGLQVLNISFTRISYDCISPDIGSLSKLTHLNLVSNGLTCELPPSVGNLTNLLHLDISVNQIRGVIPSEIGRLSKLTHLDLAGNSLSGQLPLSLGNLTNLQHLDISHNMNIFGAVPPQIGNIERLVVLDLSGTSINGTLPSTMSQLARLQVLKLDSNLLEGVFEAGIEKLPSIQMMDLSSNSISERIPSEFGYSANAEFLESFQKQTLVYLYIFNRKDANRNIK